jgi:hypothetical protein
MSYITFPSQQTDFAYADNPNIGHIAHSTKHPFVMKTVCGRIVNIADGIRIEATLFMNQRLCKPCLIKSTKEQRRGF